MRAQLEIEKFVESAPSPQTAIDLFKGRWACDLSPIAPNTVSGYARLFSDEDTRPAIGAEAANGLDGKRVLEIGPLEGGHTWQLEKLGAREIVAVEANAESFLKCLIVKELAKLTRSTFLFGDALAFLETMPAPFDLVFCSGVLYHLPDPFRMIEAIARVTGHVFVWTHFMRDEVPSDATTFGPANFRRTIVKRAGEKFTYYEGTYQDRRHGQFWGGNKIDCVWMTLDSLLRMLEHCGFSKVNVHSVDHHHPNGPCVILNAHKPS